METRYIRFNVATTDYGQPDCNVAKGKDVYVAVPRGNYSEADVTQYEAEGKAIVLIEGKAGSRVHLRPRGNTRQLMFGGTFAVTSDSRSPYVYPIHIHDRCEG